MENKNYLISVKSSQNVEGQIFENEMIFMGKYFINDKKHFIEYEEYDENKEHSTSQRSIIIDQNNTIISSKVGATNSKLILEKGQRHLCFHGTEFGDFIIGIYTHKIDCNLSDTGGKIEAIYTLDHNSKLLSKNYILINIKEVKKNVNDTTRGQRIPKEGNQ